MTANQSGWKNHVNDPLLKQPQFLICIQICNFSGIGIPCNFSVSNNLQFATKLRPCNAHSSLVDYLAQVIYAKKCPITFYCIFQLVWVPMTTSQNIRVCFRTFYKTLFSLGAPFKFI